MKNEILVKEINQHISIDLQLEISLDDLQLQLSEYINHLIKKDFQKLVFLLYRIDVSEQKLKQLLQQYPQQEAGKIIAGLIIERQSQKIISRKNFTNQNKPFSDEEKW